MTCRLSNRHRWLYLCQTCYYG
ncbi:hypothetical protein [Mucilaginibacter sp. OK268]